MDLIIPEGDKKILRGHPEGFARGMAPKDFFGTRRVIEDRIPSLTPDNDILHQFKTSSAAGR